MQGILVGSSKGSGELSAMASLMPHRFGDLLQYDGLGLGIGVGDPAKLFSDKSVTIAFSGYVAKGTAFLSAKEIHSLFVVRGLEMLEDLDGAFFMAIEDGDQVHLIRDAAGRRTGYYHFDQQHLTFANESKCIFRSPGFTPRLDEASLFKYLTFSFIPGRDTMLEGICELNPGEVVSFKQGQSLQYHSHFDCSAVEPMPELGKEHWIKEVRDGIDEEIQLVMGHPGRAGSFLSGGLDSSIITTRYAQLSSEKILTYSIHFGHKYPHELGYAKMIADRYQTDHCEFEIQPKNFLPMFHEVVSALDEPIGDPITIPNFLLARHASQECDMIFNGEGGDPCFGGPKNYHMFLHRWYSEGQPPYTDEQAYLSSYRRGYEYLKHFLSPHFLSRHTKNHTLENVLTPYFQQSELSYLNRLMSINIKEKGAHLILPKVERMHGKAGVTSISPMFTKKIVAASMAMSGQFKLHQGIEKYIFKLAFAGEIPDEIIHRPKSGMRVPVHYWFQGEMKKYAKKVLLSDDFLNLGYFDRDGIKALLRYDTESGLRRHGLLIWMLLTFETWRQGVFPDKVEKKIVHQ